MIEVMKGDTRSLDYHSSVGHNHKILDTRGPLVLAIYLPTNSGNNFPCLTAKPLL